MPARTLRARAGIALVALLLVACPKKTPPEQVYCAGVADVAADIADARAAGKPHDAVRARAIAFGTTQDEATAALLAGLVDAIYETAVLPDEAREETFMLCVQEGWQRRSSFRPPED
jgi:hypothetical protein